MEFRCRVWLLLKQMWFLLSAALQWKVLTRSPVVPLYSKNITIKKKKPAGLLFWFWFFCFFVFFPSSNHGSQAANSFPLGVFTNPGIERPNWIFSALPWCYASNIFNSWCKSDGEDCNYRLTSAHSWSTGRIPLVKAIKGHSKTQNLGSRDKMYFSILY